MSANGRYFTGDRYNFPGNAKYLDVATGAMADLPIDPFASPSIETTNGLLGEIAAPHGYLRCLIRSHKDAHHVVPIRLLADPHQAAVESRRTDDLLLLAPVDSCFRRRDLVPRSRLHLNEAQRWRHCRFIISDDIHFTRYRAPVATMTNRSDEICQHETVLASKEVPDGLALAPGAQD